LISSVNLNKLVITKSMQNVNVSR